MKACKEEVPQTHSASGMDGKQVQAHAERLREGVAWQLRELPVASWSVREVCDWVEHLGMGQYRKRFLHQRINGDLLLQLTEDHLKAS